MTKPKHSPLPWRVGANPDGVSSCTWRIFHNDPNRDDTEVTYGIGKKADADLIVSCVNRSALFEEMVGAVEDLLSAWPECADGEMDVVEDLLRRAKEGK